jgi:hypothetical protein
MTMIHAFCNFIFEREQVRLKRKRGHPAPWTEDPILREWRFCNVDREHDRETIWIREYIRGPHADHPSLWFNLALARFVNWSPTLDQMGFYKTWMPSDFISVMETRKQHGQKVWSGAYIVSTNGATKPKPNYIAEDVLTPMWGRRKETKDFTECAHWAEFFLSCNGMASFMANQVITDMKYTRYLVNALDRHTFVLAGPGTKRGINRFFERDLGFTKANFEHELIAIRKLVFRERNMRRYFDGAFEDLNNLSNCFCEFDKYQRVKNGEGTPRSRYTPRT